MYEWIEYSVSSAFQMWHFQELCVGTVSELSILFIDSLIEREFGHLKI